MLMTQVNAPEGESTVPGSRPNVGITWLSPRWWLSLPVNIANISSTVLNLLLTLLLGQVYTSLAEQITKWGE